MLIDGSSETARSVELAAKYGQFLVSSFDDFGLDIVSVVSVAGPPRWTPEDQSKAPESPMTRIIKDCLCTGPVNIGPGPDGGEDRIWDVTYEVLNFLETQYSDLRKAGRSSNLYWGSDLKTGQHNIDPKNAIAEIDRLFACQGRLWAVMYVTPEVAKNLKNTGFKVSAAIDANVQLGNVTYPLMVSHLAVVDHPRIPGQVPFAQLSHDAGKAPTEPLEEEKPMTSAELLTIQEALGKSVTVVVEGIIKPITDRLGTVEGSIASTQKLLSEMPAMLSESAKQEAAGTAFRSKANQLFADGKLNKAGLEALLKIGESTGWDEGAFAVVGGAALSEDSRRLGPTGSESTEDPNITAQFRKALGLKK